MNDLDKSAVEARKLALKRRAKAWEYAPFSKEGLALMTGVENREATERERKRDEDYRREALEARTAHQATLDEYRQREAEAREERARLQRELDEARLAIAKQGLGLRGRAEDRLTGSEARRRRQETRASTGPLTKPKKRTLADIQRQYGGK
jgi:hypothetical protein